MSQRFGYTAFYALLASLVLLGGCGARDAGLPFGAQSSAGVQSQKTPRIVTSINAQLYGNESRVKKSSFKVRFTWQRHSILRHSQLGK